VEKSVDDSMPLTKIEILHLRRNGNQIYI